MTLPEGVHGDATFSPCGRYRYRLERSWTDADGHTGGRTIAFCGLNPSYAGADEDDATVRRLCGFARRWGYSRLVLVNVYPWIETQSKRLHRVVDLVGAGNDDVIIAAARYAHRFVACWGAKVPEVIHARLLARLRVEEVPVWAFRITKGGRPEHPLYLRNDVEPFVWRRGCQVVP